LCGLILFYDDASPPVFLPGGRNVKKTEAKYKSTKNNSKRSWSFIYRELSAEGVCLFHCASFLRGIYGTDCRAGGKMPVRSIELFL